MLSQARFGTARRNARAQLDANGAGNEGVSAAPPPEDFYIFFQMTWDGEYSRPILG